MDQLTPREAFDVDRLTRLVAYEVEYDTPYLSTPLEKEISWLHADVTLFLDLLPESIRTEPGTAPLPPPPPPPLPCPVASRGCQAPGLCSDLHCWLCEGDSVPVAAEEDPFWLYEDRRNDTLCYCDACIYQRALLNEAPPEPEPPPDPVPTAPPPPYEPQGPWIRYPLESEAA